jgi:hypothetical protein
VQEKDAQVDLRVWPDMAGYGRIWLDTAGYGMGGYGRIWLDMARFLHESMLTAHASCTNSAPSSVIHVAYT